MLSLIEDFVINLSSKYAHHRSIRNCFIMFTHEECKLSEISEDEGNLDSILKGDVGTTEMKTLVDFFHSGQKCTREKDVPKEIIYSWTWNYKKIHNLRQSTLY